MIFMSNLIKQIKLFFLNANGGKVFRLDFNLWKYFERDQKKVHEIFRESEREGEKEFNDGWLMQAAGRVKC